MQNIHIPERITDPENGLVSEKSINYAYGLLITVTMLLLFGLTMLYSTSYNTAGTRFFYLQLVWAFIGMGAGVTVFVVGYKKLAEAGILLIAAALVLLVVADFFFPAIKGANRWIRFSLAGRTLSLQPSEFAKLAVALYLARYCGENMRYINSLSTRRGPLVACLVCFMVMLLVLAGKDLGTTLLIAAVAWIVFFAAGMRLILLLPPALVGIPALVYLIKRFDPERWSRLTTFLNPEICQKTDGYQLWNSMLALGSGGWFGIGFMESRLKAKYLPEAHTDFILSIVGEELGLFSICLVVALYIAFAFFALQISLNSRTRQGMFLGIALTAMLSLQAVINIGVVSGALPTKGMPAPFISYGGSNLLMCLTAIGLLLSIAAETASPGFNEELFESVKSRIPFLRKK